MNSLKNKKIVAGICGGIAAYKAAGVVSKLVQAGAKVRVIMTNGAQQFVAPLTFEALTHQKVLTSVFQDNPLAHVELAHTADLFLVMPATYNIVGKFASGLADDMLTTTVAATHAPVLIIPAMESQMYSNPLYQENQDKLKRMGYRFLEPDTGHLASGRQGVGRFPSEEKILRTIEEIFLHSTMLSGFKVLVTAGPTREMIDPMRCITNTSSGKMGFALAEQACAMGADEVLLISGPTQLAAPTGINFVKIESAEEMKKMVLACAEKYHFVIMAAAVADWRPKKIAAQKIKKLNTEKLTIELEKTPDILKELGRRKTKNQILVGFAAESENLLLNAKKKLRDKKLDMILANSLNKLGSGPESDCNQITLLYKNGKTEALPLLGKHDAAIELWPRIAQLKSKKS